MSAPGGKLLRAWRESRGLTQADAAQLVETSQALWSQWETGARTPWLAMALKLERLAGVAASAWVVESDGGEAA